MFLLTHAALGALLAEQLPTHPFLAFAAGFGSHLLTDIIPHGDSKLYKGYISGSRVRRALAYVMLDAIATIFFILTLFNNVPADAPRFAVSMGIAGGVLPDLLVAVYEVFHFRRLRWFHRVHFFFHNMITSRKGDLPFPIGLTMQLIIVLFLVSRILVIHG